MSLVIMVIMAGAVSAIASGFLCSYVLLRRRDTPAAAPFAWLMLANMIYAIAYTLEITNGSLAETVSWLKVEYVGVTMVPVGWYFFSRAFVDPGKRVTPPKFLAVALVPLVTIGLMWTNESHGLIYTSLSLPDPGPLSILKAGRGAWYWVNTVYLYGLMMFGTISLLAQVSRSSGRIWNQIVLIVVAAILPWIGHALMILGVSPLRLDLSPFLIAISGMLLAWAVFSFGLFDLVPIARRRAVDAMRDALVVIDIKGRIVDANKAAVELAPRLALAGGSAEAFFAELGFSYSGEPGTCSFSRGSEESARHYKAECREICDDQRGKAEAPKRVRGRLVILSDVTTEVELVARLERLVSTDQLTGVDNRRRFFEHAERELGLAARGGRPISFAMADLDKFKLVNDTYGHAAGDAALVHFCATCREGLRSTDLFCRYGGEEFVIILPDTEPARAVEVIERLRQRIADRPLQLEGQAVPITVSFGIAGYEAAQGAGGPGPAERGLDLDGFLKRIDQAMYRAKQAGRNRVELG